MKNTLSIAEAARLSGVTRQTIYNKIDRGDLSKSPDGHIDLSELLRVYPNLKIPDKEPEDKLDTKKSEIDSDLQVHPGNDTVIRDRNCKYTC